MISKNNIRAWSLLLLFLFMSFETAISQITPFLQVSPGGTSFGSLTGEDGSFVAISGDFSSTTKTIKWYDSSGNPVLTQTGDYLSSSYVSNYALFTQVGFNPTSFFLHIKNANNTISSFSMGTGTASYNYLRAIKDVQFTVYETSGTVKIYRLSKINGAISANDGLELPIDSVMVPSNLGGSYPVQLEKSNDLITWSNAEPGVLGSGTYKRFYRLKVGSLKSIPCVIPESTSGTVLVNLESSSDLQTWLSTTNGNYGSDAAKFFRLRIVKP